LWQYFFRRKNAKRAGKAWSGTLALDRSALPHRLVG
jgi:hypothetical protein